MSPSEQINVTQRLRILRPDSIRIKILVLAVLATLLPSLTTGWINYLENKRSLEAKATQELTSQSAQTARDLDLWIKERRYDLRVFASSYEITENVERIAQTGERAPPSATAHRRVTDYLRSVGERFGYYSELSVLSPRGQVLASSGDQAKDVTLPDDWLARLRSEAFVVGTPYWNEAHARPEVQIAVPIDGPAGKPLGSIAAAVDLKALTDTLSGFAPGESGRISLLTTDGGLIVRSHEVSAEMMQQRYPPEAVRAQLENAGLPVEMMDVTGEHVLGSMRRVPGVDWAVLAAIPSAEVYRQLAHVRNVTLLIVASTCLMAALLGYALGLVIVQPLDRLTRAAAKVAGGDLDVDLAAAKGGEVGFLTEVFNDMVARLRTSRLELERLSVTDPLTGLDNRRRMMEVLQNEVLRSRRLRHGFAVLMIDVDHFKSYNDAYGHPAGDEILKRVANVLRAATRDVDWVARYGGEEFLVLMPETRVHGAVETAERLRQGLAATPMPAGAVTVSVGIAEFPTHGDTGDALIVIADAALYEAKRLGRDRVIAAPTTERARVVRG